MKQVSKSTKTNKQHEQTNKHSNKTGKTKTNERKQKQKTQIKLNFKPRKVQVLAQDTRHGRRSEGPCSDFAQAGAGMSCGGSAGRRGQNKPLPSPPPSLASCERVVNKNKLTMTNIKRYANKQTNKRASKQASKQTNK